MLDLSSFYLGLNRKHLSSIEHFELAEHAVGGKQGKLVMAKKQISQGSVVLSLLGKEKSIPLADASQWPSLPVTSHQAQPNTVPSVWRTSQPFSSMGPQVIMIYLIIHVLCQSCSLIVNIIHYREYNSINTAVMAGLMQEFR